MNSSSRVSQRAPKSYALPSPGSGDGQSEPSETAEKSADNRHTSYLPAAGARDESSRAGIAAEAVTSLETLVWGSHHVSSSGDLPFSAGTLCLPSDPAVDSISIYQEHGILGFHRDHVAWMHNVVHIPSFQEECAKFRRTHATPSPAWLSLYYALLSAGLYYMNEGHCQDLGIQNGHGLARSLYWRCIDILNSTDFLAVHSLHALQAICLLLPCAHAFGDTKRIIVLLSSAACIAQIMQLHLLGPDPSSLCSIDDALTREIKKRVWYFLVVQDSYLITFKKAYSICMSHTTTPLPANCSELVGELFDNGRLRTLPMSCATQSSYAIFQIKMTAIKRWLHDETCKSEAKQLVLADIYKKVLQADEDMNRLRQDLPAWMKSAPALEASRRDSDLVQGQRRTFRISFAHMRLSIHRAFFCRSFTEKQYCYSHVTCLKAARLLLQTYRGTAGEGVIDMWTVPAHVLSACIIVTLNLLLCDDTDEFEQPQDDDDEYLMRECLALLRAAEKPNQLVRRGMVMIDRLLEQKEQRTSTYVSFSNDEIVKLIQEVEGIMRGDNEIATALNITFDEFLGFLDVDPLGYMRW
ncbi:hypothetical protein NKR23_g6631 [Pleurostoma richardsiae]|uniref:Xylanolytic transcriptional activator regulatory domain-containing protein n=1 Tax=Pleurostoma richardsiae TaxID=41990 RepID=A0AA38RKG5_9PEZI|nr:hypothetical protein NKR23_g6631 [Pleurostoma richardsiae]